MRKRSVIGWLRNVSIAKKLYFTVGIMALLIATELMTLLFAINTLSSVRALVGAEGLWSKAQKDAVYNLQKYGITHDEKDYVTYQNFLKVNLGDRKTRLELSKKDPDFNIARQGFLQGRFHPDDIDGAIKLVRRFHSISYIARAIGIWTKGDTMISIIQSIGDQLHNEIASAHPSGERISLILKQIDPVNSKLTGIEDEFSYTLGAGSRWLTGLILKLLFSIVLTVEISGLSLTIFVSRGITKGLNEIIKSSKKIAAGDFTVRARAYSKDEIGILANSFNEMTDKLQQNINALQQSEEELQSAETDRSRMIGDIIQRNKELEQFSYIVSHNLRSPVANIIGLAELLKVIEPTEEEGKIIMEGLFSSVTKLDNVIKDINNVLYIKNQVNERKETVKFSELIEDIKISINTLLKEEDVKIKADFSQVDTMLSIKSYLYSIFFNLISNSIKYRRADVPPVIEITANKPGNNKIELTFKDNGIGIDLKKSGGEVFGLYKRFHFHTEGKGMGLYLVKTQVETLGGKITVASEVNKGTEFKIVFDHFSSSVN